MISSRILNSPILRRNNKLRSFTVAAWLGWQIESNWADPLLFAIYSLARPIASVTILVVMYNVITNGATEDPLFAYIYLGNALYILVAAVITGVSWAVIDDREHYQVARQLHTTPINHYYYLLGRGVARIIIGMISVMIVIVFGVFFFKLPVTFANIDWLLLIGSTILGIVSLASMGVIMGAITMMMARHFWGIGEAVGGALYLFTGAIFPLSVLPIWLRPIGLIFPVTYWLEVARRAMLGPGMIAFDTLAGISNLELMGILLAFSVVLSIGSYSVYQWALVKAKDKGLLDMESGY